MVSSVLGINSVLFPVAEAFTSCLSDGARSAVGVDVHAVASAIIATSRKRCSPDNKVRLCVVIAKCFDVMFN